MAEGEEYYEEQLVEDEEKTETTILDRLLGKHFENLSARQYYVCFGPTYVFWAFLSNVLCSVLFVFSIAYWALVPLYESRSHMSHDVINAAFTDYRWTYYVTRNDLKRLPDGGMCDVTGSTAELTAKKADCANRTYAYLKNWTIITSIIGMIVSCITVAAIMYPIPPKKSNKVVDGEDKEA